MFGMGMGELVVILIVALLVLGPKRLPDVATGLGKAIRQFREATRDLQGQLSVDETVGKPFNDLRSALRDEPAAPAINKIVPPTPAPIALGAVVAADVAGEPHPPLADDIAAAHAQSTGEAAAHAETASGIEAAVAHVETAAVAHPAAAPHVEGVAAHVPPASETPKVSGA